MNTIEARRRLLGRNVYKRTTEGNPAIAQGSLARRYPGITMQGWTEQAQYEGKNLLPVDVGQSFTGQDVRDSAVFAEDGVMVSYNDISPGERRDIYMFGDGVSSTNESSYVDIPEITPGKYHICNDSAMINFYVVVWRNGASVVLGFSNTSTTPIAIEEGDKFQIFFSCNNPGDGVQEYTIHPMLVKDGGELTTYEPYVGGQPSPSPDYPQPITSAGKYNEGTEKWEYEITIANAQTDPDKNQTVLITSDRPLTKWDKLEKRNGQWGWVYKSDEIVLYGSEEWKLYPSFAGYYSPYILPFSTTRREGYSDRGYVGYYSDRFSIWIGVNNSDIYVCFAPTYNEELEDRGVDNWKNFLSENPITIITYLDEETFVPLTESEQETMNELYTFRPTTVLSNDCECEMTLTYKTKKSLEVAT